jgi:DNA-directed RNA polymerase subunit M/transcription elongation factor TFIIS
LNTQFDPAMRWVQELQNAIPTLAVVPHLRFLTIQHLRARGTSFTNAVALETMALQNSLGKMKLYISFVQNLMTAPPDIVPVEFDSQCRRADDTQQALSVINIKRDDLIARLTAQVFKCPEVPEANESHRSCPKCKCNELQAIEKQTRGADESGTVFYSCTNKKCGYTFR